MKNYEVIILGSGLASLITACYLSEKTDKEICIVSKGYGGTPYIAAFNAVFPDNPRGDSPKQYADDMFEAGYSLGNRALIDEFSRYSLPGIDLLERWGVTFTPGENYRYLLRHCSGSSVPRSLCRSDMLVGNHIVQVLIPALKKKGVTFIRNAECMELLTDDEGICGVTVKQGGDVFNIYSRCVVAGWGGIGHLYKDTTYPADIDGRTLAMAYNAGAKLIDLEFVEFEPMVVLYPEVAKGEPCPTAMLGEGGYLRNSKGDRFLLKVRPQGEAGAPKSLINTAIEEEVKAGRGNSYGGVFADLRHLDVNTLKAYPWFYNRLIKNGVDPSKDLVVVGPVAHSHSGGIEIDSQCKSNIKGLYAVGEAAGGMHGACRMAGNACTQAAVSGYAAGLAIADTGIARYTGEEKPVCYKEKDSVREEYADEIRELISCCVFKERYAGSMLNAADRIRTILDNSKEDTFTQQLALSALLILKAACERTESRGTHHRGDYPQSDDTLYSVEIEKGKDGIIVRRINREVWK